MTTRLTKIDDRMIKLGMLEDTEYRTDYRMKDLQKYNIPHWADLDLKFIKPLYQTVSVDEVVEWGSLFYIGNFYTENDGSNDNIQWDRKYWMNEIMCEGRNSGKRHCTPFILFKQLEDKSYELIDINKTAVEVGPNGRSYLYINDLNGDKFYDDSANLKVLLLPTETDYLCSNMESTEDREEQKEDFNMKYDTPAANITISDNNELSFDSDEWYEKIKLITMDMNIYKGSISETDRAINVDSGIEYGKKIYLNSLILVNPEGHVDLSYMEDGVIKEMENNILYFNTDRFTGYKYYIFFFTESNKSVNMIYDIPEGIINHDTEQFVNDGSDFILLDRDTFVDIMSENGKYDLSLKVKDLRNKYMDLFKMEISPETYKEVEAYYLHDEDGNVILDKDGAPLLDPSKFDITEFNIKDGVFPIDGESYSWSVSSVQFINYWFYRVLNYKKNLLMAFVNDDYKMFDRDIKYTSITYNAPEYIPGEELEDVGLMNSRNKWTLYDEDQDYDGWTDMLVFINGKLDLDACTCSGNKSYIDRDHIINMYGEDCIVEVMYINYNADKVLDVIIDGDNPNKHLFIADRYYDPRSLRFFNVLEDVKMTNVDTTPIYGIEDMSNPTLTQPIPFRLHLTDKFENYSIQFNENWAELVGADESSTIDDKSNGAILYVDKDHIYAEVINNGQIKLYDIAEANKILYNEYKSETTLEDYLKDNSIKMDSCEYIDKMENPKSCISFDYTDSGNVSAHGIVNIYGNSINDSIHINTSLKTNYTIEGESLGNITKATKNMVEDGFGVLNSDDKLFDIAYHPIEGFHIRNTIGLDINNMYPIESHNLKSNINTKSNSEVYYKNETVYILSCPLGEDITKGLDLYDANGNLLYDKYGNNVKDSTVKVNPPVKSILKSYKVKPLVDKDPLFTEQDTVELPAIFIGAKLIGTKDYLYIIGGNTGHNEIDKSCFKYSLADKTLTELEYPDWIGYSNMAYTLNKDETKLIIFGGLGDWPEDTANKIAVLDLATDTWSDPVASTINFVNSTVICHNDEYIIFGGYTNEYDGTTDFENTNRNVYKVNIETGEATIIGTTEVPFISAKATNFSIRGGYLISCNKYPEYSNYLYRYNPDTGNFARFLEMPAEYDYASCCEFNYDEDMTSLLFTGNIENGFDSLKVLNIRHNDVDCFFADKDGNYNVIIDGVIYNHDMKIKYWLPVKNIKKLVENGKITQIQISGDIYVALATTIDNKVYTTPDLHSWYDYKITDFYDEDVFGLFNGINCMDFITTKLDDMNSDEFDRNEGLSIFITKEGALSLNPYCMNMSMYYGNPLLIASTNRFATDKFSVDSTTDYITLSAQFKYCLDDSHYMVFEDGKLLDTDCYKIIKPSIYSPINGINIYLNYHREEDYEAMLQVVYLPFPMIDTKAKTELRESSGVLEIGSNGIQPFGVNNKWNWIFSNGEKIPARYMENISNNLIYLNQFDYIDWSNHPKVYRTYGDDLVQTNLVNDKLDEFVDDLIKNVVKDSHWGDDAQIDISEFTEKATFEEKIILLKVYADHYVANADEKGNTAPFILDSYQGQFYDVLNGNIEWRD